jgi:hypothetical protein
MPSNIKLYTFPNVTPTQETQCKYAIRKTKTLLVTIIIYNVLKDASHFYINIIYVTFT